MEVGNLRNKCRRALVAAGAVPILLLGATPAHAAADVGIAFADGPVPWALTAECSVVAGYTTNATSVTFVIKATAHAEGVAIGTQVGCTVYKEDGTTVGGCSRALPGPTRVCEDLSVTVPIGDVPSFCVTASALYATGIAQLPPCPS